LACSGVSNVFETAARSAASCGAFKITEASAEVKTSGFIVILGWDDFVGAFGEANEFGGVGG